MRPFKFIPVFLLMLSVGVSTALAENYIFRVLASNGDVKVKTNNRGQWEKLKTGSRLFENDKIKIGSNSHLGLVHKSGRALQVSAPREYTVSDLAGKLSKSSTVTGRFTQFILDEMQESDNLMASDNYNMDVTGSVERSTEGLPFMSSGYSFRVNTPRKINYVDPKASFTWFNAANDGKYKFIITDRFDRPIYTAEVSDTVYNVDLDKIKLDKDVYYFWHVVDAADESKKSEDGCFLLYSDNEVKAVKDSLNLLKEELGDVDNPVSKVMLGYFYETKDMIPQAMDSYKEAVELSGGTADYKQIYDKFLRRMRLYQ